MSETLVEASSYDSVVVPTSGDARTAASVKTPFQAVTNRTKYLYDLVNAVRKLRIVADEAAMTALTGMSNGDIALIRSGASMGLYVYDGASSATVKTGWVVDGNASTGRWLNLVYRLVTLGATSADHRWAIPPANFVPGFAAAVSAGGDTAIFATVTATTETEVADFTITIPNCKTGDRVMLDWCCSTEIDAGSVSASGRAYLYGGVSSVDAVAGATAVIPGVGASGYDKVGPIHLTALDTVDADGTYTAKLMVKTTVSGGGVRFTGRGCLRAIVLRA